MVSSADDAICWVLPESSSATAARLWLLPATTPIDSRSCAVAWSRALAIRPISSRLRTPADRVRSPWPSASATCPTRRTASTTSWDWTSPNPVARATPSTSTAIRASRAVDAVCPACACAVWAAVDSAVTRLASARLILAKVGAPSWSRTRPKVTRSPWRTAGISLLSRICR